jgi:putative ABC transport system permease protein
VGVVGDVHVGGGPGGVGSDAQRRESIFMPLAQQPRSSASIVLATDGDPMVLTPDVRATVAAIDPNLPIYEIDSMEGVIDTNTWIFGLFGSMFGIFGMIALFMSAVGLYGVMAFSVNRRTQEMGIRMAMGASTFRIMRMVLRTGLSQIAIGMIVGLAVGALAARPLRYIMFDVETNDLSVYGSIVLTLVLTGLIACLAPARRATRVDLVTALRAE